MQSANLTWVAHEVTCQVDHGEYAIVRHYAGWSVAKYRAAGEREWERFDAGDGVDDFATMEDAQAHCARHHAERSALGSVA